MEPLRPFFSGTVRMPAERHFWMAAEEWGDVAEGLSWMGLRSIPEANRFNMRPPRIRRAPV